MQLWEITQRIKIVKDQLMELDQAPGRGTHYAVRKAQLDKQVLALNNEALSLGTKANIVQVTCTIKGQHYLIDFTGISVADAKVLFHLRYPTGIIVLDGVKEIIPGVPRIIG